MIGDGGLATLTDEDDPGADVVPLGQFLYEPDGAVIRAGLVTAVAAGVDGGLLDRHIAYVTADASFRTPFARSYEVLETLPHREKPLRAALHERGIGRLTIKKRGVDVVPDQLRKRLALTRRRRGHHRADPRRRPGHLPAGAAVLRPLAFPLADARAPTRSRPGPVWNRNADWRAIGVRQTDADHAVSVCITLGAR